MSAPRITEIPEIILHVLAELKPSKYDDSAVKTLVACTRASRGLAKIAQMDSVWVKHYHVRYRYSEPTTVNRGQSEWYKRYISRRATDLRVVELLNEIISTPQKRAACILELVQFGDDALDALRIEAACKVPAQLGKMWAREEQQRKEAWGGARGEWSPGENGEEDLDNLLEDDSRVVTGDWLQRRWWAKQAFRTMVQKAALKTLAKLFLGEQPHPKSMASAKAIEEGLKAISGLMGIHPDEMNRNYDNLANGCARHLKSIGICIDLHSTDFDLRAFSIGVCNWMRSQGLRYEDDGKRRGISNYLPHTFMTLRNTHSMSLVCTFMAIVTRLGLCAVPMVTPAPFICFHAWVCLPGAESDDDMRDWEDGAPTRQLVVDVVYFDHEPFWRPGTTPYALMRMDRELSESSDFRPEAASYIIWRQARMISARLSHSSDQSLPSELRHAVEFAANMALLISQREPRRKFTLMSEVVALSRDRFPLHTEPVLAQELAMILDQTPDPSIGTHLRTEIDQLRKDEVYINQRKQEGGPLWWVGMVFRHRSEGYVGVMIDWDEANEVEDGSEDMESDEDDEPASRTYTGLVGDGSSRNIAEEDVEPLSVTNVQGESQEIWESVQMLIECRTSTIEEVFSRVEVNEELGRAWFVPSADIAREYPGDTAMGAKYMKGTELER